MTEDPRIAVLAREVPYDGHTVRRILAALDAVDPLRRGLLPLPEDLTGEASVVPVDLDVGEDQAPRREARALKSETQMRGVLVLLRHLVAYQAERLRSDWRTREAIRLEAMLEKILGKTYS